MKLVSDWRTILRKSYAIRTAAFWGAVVMLGAMWPSLVDILPTWVFIVVGLLIGASVAVARVLKQPGID